MPFENGPNFAKLYEIFSAIFLCKSIQNSGYFETFCDFLYQFSTIYHRRHILYTQQRNFKTLIGGGGGGGKTIHP
jgi:hypothetical protein